MREKKTVLIGMIFVFVILCLSFITSYSQSSVQFTQYQPSPGLFGWTSSFDFDDSMCKEGQDFLIQVAPLGCTPSVIRSDLLEEQNVPVFCQLDATKINPLIDVKAIEGLSFTGEYPEGVSAVGFEPYRSALGGEGTFNKPIILDNIGYAVIVLEKQPVESKIPDSIEGTLGIKIKYDIKNAFGIGKNSFYLPILTDDEWEARKNQYSFWRGRGYLRVEDIGDNRAKIAVYDGNLNKVKTVTLDENSASEKIYLPGFYCLSSLELELEELEAPDTTALLRIDNDYIEVKKGQKFLEDRCSVSDLYEAGVLDSVVINCREDEATLFGSKSHTLSIVPKLNLSINGDEEEYGVGDLLYTYPEPNSAVVNYVYLGYANTQENSGIEEDLRIALISIPSIGAKLDDQLDDSSLKYVSRLVSTYDFDPSSFSREGGTRAVIETGKALYGLISNAYSRLVEGEAVAFVYFDGTVKMGIEPASVKPVYGDRNVTINGFIDPVNLNMDTGTSNMSKASQYYDLAENDFNNILSSYHLVEAEPNMTYGERAFEELIRLNKDFRQNRRVIELCEDFKKKYEDSDSPDECDDISMSNSNIDSILITVNGKTRRITLDGIYEPGLDEFSAEVLIQGPNGKTRKIVFAKGRTVYLDDFRGKEDEPFDLGIYLSVGKISFDSFDSLKGAISSRNLYVKFDSLTKTWKYSYDSSTFNWKSISLIKNETGLPNSKKKALFSLEGKDFDTGKLIVLNEAGYGVESLELIDLEKESATFKVNLAKSGVVLSIKDYALSNTRTLELGKSNSLSSDYVFTLNKVNLKENARITVNPGIENTGSEANFSFKIGIEKRGIQLSPSKTKAMIKNINESIEEWNDTSEKIGSVVSVLKKSCLIAGVGLTIKNLITNLGGKGVARQNVMREDGGWHDICSQKVKAKEFSSLEACYSANSDKINKAVDLRYKFQQQEQEEIKKLQEGTIKKGGILGEDVVNTSAFMAKYVPNVNKYLEDNKLNTFNYSGDMVNISEVLSYKMYSQQGTFTPENIRDMKEQARILASKESTPEMKAIAQKRLNSIQGRVYSASEEYKTIQSLSNKYDVPFKDAVRVPDKNVKYLAYTGRTGKDFGLPPEYDNSPAQLITHLSGNYIAVLEQDADGNYGIMGFYGADTAMYYFPRVFNAENKELISKVPEVFEKIVFKKADESTYKNKGFENPTIHFYDTPPYEGLPAIIPIDTKNGWYVATQQTLPSGTPISAYDKSGRVSSFYLCHVGNNARQEFKSGIGDDICQMINLGTRDTWNQFPGLDEREAKKYVDCGVQAIEQASRSSKTGTIRINTKCGTVTAKVGEPAINIPNIQCEDFMSPGDCRLLYNLCDPVVCPSSRCDLGGTYPVRDPIQTGIIGGLILCLPNFPEVYVPVCLTGVQAGLDGLISVFTARRDCLQEQLDTGRTVGICDEMHSVYLCELMWKQAIPLLEVGLPKLIGSLTGTGGARGGGEYFGVKSALDTAGKSFSFFTQQYAENSFSLFKTRSTEQIGTEICRNYISGVVPNMDIFDQLTEPDSPVQFHARFDEIPFTTMTNPPISHYKVYYHIYAGKESAAYYKVYLKGDSSSSYYQDTSQSRTVAQGYIAIGDIATETSDFTAPSGYTQLCVSVNGQEKCGFKQVTTSFALDYVRNQYIAQQTQQIDIKTQSGCISGSSSVYSLLSPNLQEGVHEAVNPSVYNHGITRICATHNPGLGTDLKAEGNGSRWVDVGYCDDPKLRCWIDTSKIDEITSLRTTEDEILSTLNQNTLKVLQESGKYIQNLSDELMRVDNLDREKKIEALSDLFSKIFYDRDRAKLYLERGKVYAEIARDFFDREFARVTEEEAEEPEEIEEIISKATKCEDCGLPPNCTRRICEAINDKLEDKNCIFYSTLLDQGICSEEEEIDERFTAEELEIINSATECESCSISGKINCHEELCLEIGRNLGIECVYTPILGPLGFLFGGTCEERLPTKARLALEQVGSFNYVKGEPIVKFFEDLSQALGVEIDFLHTTEFLEKYPSIRTVDDIKFGKDRLLRDINLRDALEAFGMEYHLEEERPNIIFIDDISTCVLDGNVCQFSEDCPEYALVKDKVCFESNQVCCKRECEYLHNGRCLYEFEAEDPAFRDSQGNFIYDISDFGEYDCPIDKKCYSLPMSIEDFKIIEGLTARVPWVRDDSGFDYEIRSGWSFLIIAYTKNFIEYDKDYYDLRFNIEDINTGEILHGYFEPTGRTAGDNLEEYNVRFNEDTGYELGIGYYEISVSIQDDKTGKEILRSDTKKLRIPRNIRFPNCGNGGLDKGEACEIVGGNLIISTGVKEVMSQIKGWEGTYGKEILDTDDHLCSLLTAGYFHKTDCSPVTWNLEKGRCDESCKFSPYLICGYTSATSSGRSKFYYPSYYYDSKGVGGFNEWYFPENRWKYTENSEYKGIIVDLEIKQNNYISNDIQNKGDIFEKKCLDPKWGITRKYETWTD